MSINQNNNAELSINDGAIDTDRGLITDKGLANIEALSSPSQSLSSKRPSGANNSRLGVVEKH